MKKILYFLNLLRSIPAWVIISHIGVKDIVKTDLEKYKYAVCKEENISDLMAFNRVAQSKKMFHNVLYYRVKKENKIIAQIIKVLYPLKSDLEICDGDIGEGLAIYHGHGTVILCEKIGSNFSVWQGVTIGRNPKSGMKRNLPIIGNNVSIYTNAVVAGGISIGDNVSIGAGAVVMKDVPDNSIVIGNPCVIKRILE